MSNIKDSKDELIGKLFEDLRWSFDLLRAFQDDGLIELDDEDLEHLNKFKRLEEK